MRGGARGHRCCCKKARKGRCKGRVLQKQWVLHGSHRKRPHNITSTAWKVVYGTASCTYVALRQWAPLLWAVSRDWTTNERRGPVILAGPAPLVCRSIQGRRPPALSPFLQRERAAPFATKQNKKTPTLILELVGSGWQSAVCSRCTKRSGLSVRFCMRDWVRTQQFKSRFNTNTSDINHGRYLRDRETVREWFVRGSGACIRHPRVHSAR